MPISLIGAFHVLTAVIGLTSGMTAMFLRKGSGLHGAAGSIFTVSMLCMSASGAYHSAFVKPVPSNVLGGLMTFYLVVTAWRTARQRQGGTAGFDVAALLLGVFIGLYGIGEGLRAASGSPDPMTPMYFAFGSVALLSVFGDLRMIRRGGSTGGRRIARHLWRMCLALLIGLGSLYPGQAQLFPHWLRETNLLFVPHVLVLGSMLFWIARMAHRRRLQQATSATEPQPGAPLAKVA